MAGLYKKIVAVVAAALVAIVAVTARPAPRFAEESGALNVVCTIFPPYDFARQIGQEDAQVSMLLKPGVESHSYDPTPADIIGVEQADLFIYIGGENDAWVEKMLASIDTSGMTILRLIDYVETIEVEHDHAGEAADERDAGDVEIDEHIWTSPRNAIQLTEAISQAMQRLDADNAALYAQRAQDYEAELEALDGRFTQLVEGAARTQIVFGDRFPFAYFACDYGLTCYAAFDSCSSETEPSAQAIAFLIDTVREDGIPAVFHIEQGDVRVAQIIAEETGAQVLELHSCHNLLKSELEAGETYVSLMEKNLEALSIALS